jgi:hypothetical protein
VCVCVCVCVCVRVYLRAHVAAAGVEGRQRETDFYHIPRRGQKRATEYTPGTPLRFAFRTPAGDMSRGHLFQGACGCVLPLPSHCFCSRQQDSEVLALPAGAVLLARVPKSGVVSAQELLRGTAKVAARGWRLTT